MTEITRQLSIYICQKCDCAGCADCNKGIDKNSKTITGLTKERNDLEHYIKKRMEVADKIFKENRELKSKLSNRDKEIEELKKSADEILYYDEYPDNPRSDIFDVVFDWPTGAHGRVDSYSVITGPSTWCVRTPNSFKKFENEEDALEYSENLQSKEGEEE